jgi:hypothetical protein
MHCCDGFEEGIHENLQAGSNRNTLSGIEVSTGVSSEKHMTAMAAYQDTAAARRQHTHQTAY